MTVSSSCPTIVQRQAYPLVELPVASTGRLTGPGCFRQSIRVLLSMPMFRRGGADGLTLDFRRTRWVQSPADGEQREAGAACGRTTGVHRAMMEARRGRVSGNMSARPIGNAR